MYIINVGELLENQRYELYKINMKVVIMKQVFSMDHML